MVAVAVIVVPSFEELVPPQRPLLLAYALRLTRDRALAEDIVQETLVKALEAWSRFQLPSSCSPEAVIRGWLYRIVHNEFISSCRRRSRWGEEELQEWDATVEHAQEEPGYSDEVVAAMGALDADQRRVIHMVSVEGLSYQETAVALGVPIGTVMSRLSRARRKLEAMLTEYAESSYRLRRQGAGEDTNRLEPAETPEPEADSVDCVVSGLDAEQLVG